MTYKPLKLVCIGGGTGLSTLLSGIRQYSRASQSEPPIVDMDQLAAVVSVSDDGGSTGRLIDEFDVLPPGDVRKLLVSLSEADDLVANLFEYRFSGNGDLGGHTVGNILLTALIDQNGGSFPKAILAASELLAVRGRIIPASLQGNILCAELADGDIIRGQSSIPIRQNRELVKRIFLEPRRNGGRTESSTSSKCVANPDAVEAISDADAIIIGPGSLYTSIMPNLAYEEISEAVCRSNAIKVYVCNVMSQPGETDGYSVSDHIRAIQNHAHASLDYVIVNEGLAPKNVIQNYVQKQLLNQFSRIQVCVNEGASMVEERFGKAIGSMADLTKNISQISEEILQMADPSRVQVLYDPEVDDLEGAKLVKASIICDTMVIENGIELNVIRHNPEKLATTLFDTLLNDFQSKMKEHSS
ncbi:TPA: uridine diphosphate-N-acetylglucosamine-binding protein YvcK [Candidatus Poribacteria bacterium]|nr:uridine diphosphate-N-acetylglucosamine-binding protein YvcK [Candidatus Poribacteria bacterium]HIA70026.1 uridine diphosphate-N-acetylglucosamine-binding protein YvcK [Candidatus Poribacteria bacterium]HIB90660.1 uridine diphosphate-N-acetylglucosamine-binding protein YvcK [Candidatus Poribacteria bacterium]HIB99602.1 uridine diphosphate-N-acetylglucosamine-binding protein YvcK [Candidatus Poribacteria bacterium]HIO49370.1 uridine diphosphate-N-acetylglucosamine-binding protein YvcK [Candid